VRKILGTCLIVMGLMLLSIPAQAYTVVDAVPGTTQEVQSVSEVVNGPDMAGMVVTVTGLNAAAQPFTDTRTWVADLAVDLSPPVYGGIFAGGDQYLFYLYQAGDTYTNAWMLYSYYDVLIKSITIDALPGNVVFDRTIDGMEKTPDSGQGKDFFTTYTGTTRFPTLATYRDQVAVGGEAPQGDLYRTLEIKFIVDYDLSPFGQGFNDSVDYELFTADTDRITPVVPVPLVAPLGSSLTLLATGLLGIIGLRRKWRK
jgi:hypothetical protein